LKIRFGICLILIDLTINNHVIKLKIYLKTKIIAVLTSAQTYYRLFKTSFFLLGSIYFSYHFYDIYRKKFKQRELENLKMRALIEDNYGRYYQSSILDKI